MFKRARTVIYKGIWFTMVGFFILWLSIVVGFPIYRNLSHLLAVKQSPEILKNLKLTELSPYHVETIFKKKGTAPEFYGKKESRDYFFVAGKSLNLLDDMALRQRVKTLLFQEKEKLDKKYGTQFLYHSIVIYQETAIINKTFSGDKYDLETETKDIIMYAGWLEGRLIAFDIINDELSFYNMNGEVPEDKRDYFKMSE